MNTRKYVKTLLSTLMALVLTALMAVCSSPVINVKAEEKVYVFNSETDEKLNISKYADKTEPLAEGNYGTDGYFRLVGENFKASKKNLLETVKRGASYIEFTVTGIANIEIAVSSNGSSSTSNVVLQREDGSYVKPIGQDKDVISVSGSEAVVFKFNGVTAGVYKLLSPGGIENDGRGFRLFYISSTQDAEGGVAERPAWNTVKAPVIASASQNGASIDVSVNAVVGNAGGDKLTVDMYDSNNKLVDSASSVVDTKFSFVPTLSDKYYFVATLERDGETAIVGEKSAACSFTYLLAKPVIGNVANAGNGAVMVSWGEVKEATSYEVFYKLSGDSEYKSAGTSKLTTASVTGLSVDKEYEFYVAAFRGSEKTESASFKKIVRNRVERNWVFTYFGSSTGANRNYMTDLDEDAFTFKLVSCTYNKDGSIDLKGGKFTSFFDGISYYYTKIDAAKENFELTATFKVDYINPVPDGQEGFGIVIRDSLGEHGVSSSNFETNSVSLIATKFEATQDGTKYSMKDGLGVRFSYGLTPENIADGTMSTLGIKKTFPCQYTSGNLINAGDEYTLTVKKTNTGYHCIYTNSEGETMEKILYGVDKLLQIDKDYVYVGFAVARGCNVTVSNVSFVTTSTETDPPAEPEPEPSFKTEVVMVSPEGWGSKEYIARFRANSDGKAYIADVFGKAITEKIEVKANQIVEIKVPAEPGNNSFTVCFEANKEYRNELNEIPDKQYVDKQFDVTIKIYDQDVLYVTPDGDPTGKGTKESPMSIRAAMAYAVPGQKIVLADGVYEFNYLFKIPKGNSGNAENFKYMVAEEGAHPVFDFSKSTDGGFVIWGDYWYFEGFDVCNTPDNYKGIQLAGSNNILYRINAYNNGDTGIQISGSSNDPKAEWPKYNSVINCTSHDNADSAMNNGDGFAAKLTVGDGNKFSGCIAYNNIDDGWDLYAKVESGAIGVVTIENCISYCNGYLSDGRGYGDGNGFKLGGEGIAVAHVIKNSLAYSNHASGITSNSNPAVQIYSCTTYGNGGYGVALYGKGDQERNFVVEGIISLANKSEDNLEQNLQSDINFFQSGKSKAANLKGTVIDESVFASVDVIDEPTRDEKSNIVLTNDLLVVTDTTLDAKVGAKLEKTEYVVKEPTVPTPTPEVEPSKAPEENPDATVTPEATSAPNQTPSSTKSISVLGIIFIVLGVITIAAVVVAVVLILKKKNK